MMRFGGTITLNGLLAYLAYNAEKILIGSEKTEEAGTRAGKAAVEGATTLNFNQFKVPLMENLIRRAIRDA